METPDSIGMTSKINKAKMAHTRARALQGGKRARTNEKSGNNAGKYKRRQSLGMVRGLSTLEDHQDKDALSSLKLSTHTDVNSIGESSDSLKRKKGLNNK